ncbi:UMP-CMP kinase [Bagarius yarrelli]|uniref:UMP-CMP kinase n=1 Tax=Bagarius yarrelli TaxID=175774 RepID=A0A556TZT8_BAGYA|nr:UMP-CMP kinase [Bagarius yarrelli]
MNPVVVFVLGGPGAGKGTQCSKIAEHYSYTHLSAGELLRAECRRANSEFSHIINSCFKRGELAPVEVTITLLRRAMEQTMMACKTKFYFLIDGFPPDKENLKGWMKVMKNKADIKFILFLDCSNEVCVNRCLERGKTGGRDDDNKESLERRIQMYLNFTRPIIERFEKLGKVHTIDASRSVNEVRLQWVKFTLMFPKSSRCSYPSSNFKILQSAV